jgi:hypothetical protein
MPQNGLLLSPNNSKAAVYDKDAVSYFSRAGVTDATAKSQINAFVKGVKNLGLYNSMVCWPLRSAQNKGSGTTAYSLGGLGIFDATLTGGPAWGANGIILSSTAHEITLPDNASIYNLRTGFAAFNPSSSVDNQRIIEIQDNATIQGWYCLFRYGGGASETGAKYLVTRNSLFTNNAPNIETASLNSFRSSAFTANNTSDNVFRDGSLVSGGAKTGLLTINPTGSRALRQLFANTSSMVGSFGLISTSTLSDANISSLHSLYKTTLGQGLGLP